MAVCIVACSVACERHAEKIAACIETPGRTSGPTQSERKVTSLPRSSCSRVATTLRDMEATTSPYVKHAGGGGG